MLDGYHILTLSHRDAPLEQIGQAVLRNENAVASAEAQLPALKHYFQWEELYYMATCNRVLFLFYTQAPLTADLPQQLLQFIRPDLPLAQVNDIATRMRCLHGAEAVRHLLEVAGSLDSLVVGEREIIRQLRESYDFCRSIGVTGDHIRLLMRFAIETAKDIYTQTGIGEKAVSVVALAFQQMMAAQLHVEARILLIGAGRTNTLFAKFLSKYGFRKVTVFNRSLAAAEKLAASFQGCALPLDALPHYTEGFDAIIVCTAATEPIVTCDLYRRLLQGDDRAKVLVDLSIPNNADRALPKHFNLQLIDIESLKSASELNMLHRQREREKAAALIDSKIYVFRERWHERQVERSMAHIPAQVQAVKERALREVFGKEFAQLDAHAQDLTLRMLEYMEKKCVAIPMKAVKAIALHKMGNKAVKTSE